MPHVWTRRFVTQQGPQSQRQNREIIVIFKRYWDQIPCGTAPGVPAPVAGMSRPPSRRIPVSRAGGTRGMTAARVSAGKHVPGMRQPSHQVAPSAAPRRWHGFSPLAALAASILTACAPGMVVSVQSGVGPALGGTPGLWLDRVTWGANDSAVRDLRAVGTERYLHQQLYQRGDALPVPVQAAIAGLSISQQPLEQIVLRLEAQRKAAEAIANADDKKSAQQS